MQNTMMRSATQRSLAVFPAGSNGEFNLPPEFATVISRGEGCELWTADGRRMLDFSMGWGSALVGHARPEVADAVAAQLRHGLQLRLHYRTIARARGRNRPPQPGLRSGSVLRLRHGSHHVLLAHRTSSHGPAENPQIRGRVPWRARCGGLQPVSHRSVLIIPPSQSSFRRSRSGDRSRTRSSHRSTISKRRAMIIVRHRTSWLA